jgi:hypothetical protein
MIKDPADIIEMEVTPDLLSAAQASALEMGKLPNSFTGGRSNLAGFVGEFSVLKYLTGSIDQGLDNTYQYDIIFNELKIDVKSKRTNVKPLLHYECSIAKLNTRQLCDVYVFTRVKNDYSLCWLLGFLPKAEYFELANFMEKGTIDPSNGWKVSSDCYNVPIEELRPLNELTKFTYPTVSS